ncbi:hypothetical protein EHM69_01315 [candidate division KSB1 bacterium]|nr:MAG: hypothetical protein EHM69_01315 [candidate division KSB1 bacterium]
MKRLAVSTVMILCWCSLLAAPSPVPSGVSALTYPERIHLLEEETQAQMTVLFQQVAADPAQRESIERQIIKLKNQAEIHRLEILLEWAEAEGNQNKAAEIRKALDQWRTPVVPPKQSPVPRDAPNATGIVPESKDSSR